MRIFRPVWNLRRKWVQFGVYSNPIVNSHVFTWEKANWNSSRCEFNSLFQTDLKSQIGVTFSGKQKFFRSERIKCVRRVDNCLLFFQLLRVFLLRYLFLRCLYLCKATLSSSIAWDNQGPRYDFENGGGGHIREAARFTITLGANKISNFKGKWLGNDETI